MTRALEESIAELLHASQRDENLLRLELDDANFGLHAQQAVEKLLKALIAGHEVRPTRTHDIATLLADLERLQVQVPTPTLGMTWLSAFAGVWRYQALRGFEAIDRDRLRKDIVELRVWVLGQLDVLLGRS